MITFHLPSSLQGLAGGRKSLPLQADTLAQALAQLDAQAPLLRSQLFEPSGAVRQFVGLFVDNVQHTGSIEEAPPLREGSQIVAVLAVAGG